MGWIEVSYRNRAPSKKVWKAWISQNPNLKKRQKNQYFVYQSDKKKIAYCISDIVLGKSFSTVWRTAPFLHFIFRYQVNEAGRVSLITFSARLKGFYAPLVQLFLKKNVRKKLEGSLKTFVDQIEMMP